MLAIILFAQLTLSGVTAYDGDTFRSARVSDRLAMVDTPEIGERAACPAEDRLGVAARDRVRTLFASARRLEAVPDRNNPGRRSVDASGWPLDRHGRRLAFIRVDGRDLGGILVAEGLGVHWNPRRTHDWCAAASR
jgi:endonuclease YncB( thermonuclease family)